MDGWIHRHRHFGGACCFLLQGRFSPVLKRESGSSFKGCYLNTDTHGIISRSSGIFISTAERNLSRNTSSPEIYCIVSMHNENVGEVAYNSGSLSMSVCQPSGVRLRRKGNNLLRWLRIRGGSELLRKY